jgi:acyl carrier protein
MTIHSEIKGFILQNFMFTTDASALGDFESLLQKGVVDSTGILELIMHLEQVYSIKILDEEMLPANLDSVEAIAAFVMRKRA